VALTILAALLRFYGIGHQGFWFDEANTAQLVHLSPGQMLTLIKHYESTPPLYYCVAWLWAHAFGYGEAPLRSLSALFGVLVVPVAYGVAAKLISRRVGLVAAALAACNPLLIWYSQEARAYEMVVLLTGVSLLAFAIARTSPTPAALAAWAVACALAMATEYYSLLVIVPEAVWLLLELRRNPAVRGAAAAIAICCLPLLWLAISQNHTGHASWIAPIPLGPRLGQIIPQFLIGFGAPAQQPLTRVAELIALVALAALALRSGEPECRVTLGVGVLALAGLALNLLLIAAGIDDLITRNVISLWLPAAVLVAGGLGARGAGRLPGRLGIAAAAALCAIGVAAAAGVAADRNLQRPDWRGVARVLGTGPAPGVGQRAILLAHYRDLLPLSLYLPRMEFWPGRSAIATTELDVVSISAPRVNLCWWGAACNLVPARMQRSYPIAGFHEAWVRHVYQFTVMRLVADRPVALTPQLVSRALTTTTLGRDLLVLQR